MRFLRWTFSVILLLAAQAGGRAGQSAPGTGPGAGAPPMVLSSAAFPDGGQIPVKYTAAADRTSPALRWTNTPPNTVSFVLHMHDLDAAINHTTEDSLHWLMWNIPGSATGLPEGVPQGAQLKDGSYQVSSKTQLDQRGQGYRAPGAGANGPMHHYTFEIFALDTKLDVTPAPDAFDTRRNVMKALQGHVLGKAVYVGLFHLPTGVTPRPLP